MKTAMQAFRDAINNLNTETNRELFEVSLKIDEAVKNGKFYICERGELNSFTVNELTKLGYDVTHDYINSIWYYFVGWFACDVYKDDLVGYKPSNPSNNQPTADSNNKRNKSKFPIFRR